MASRAYKRGEYFRRSVLAKSVEKSSEHSDDNSVDISRKDLDDDNQLSTRARGKAARLGKMCKRNCHAEKSKKSQGKRKASFAPESATKKA